MASGCQGHDSGLSAVPRRGTITWRELVRPQAASDSSTGADDACGKQAREDAVKNLEGDYGHHERYGMIPQGEVAWRILGRWLLPGLCIASFSALFFIGAATVIGWML